MEKWEMALGSKVAMQAPASEAWLDADIPLQLLHPEEMTRV